MQAHLQPHRSQLPARVQVARPNQLLLHKRRQQRRLGGDV